MNSGLLSSVLRGFARPFVSRVFLVLSLSVMITTSPRLWGSVTGSISGTVSDSSGAIIPGASVAALNVGTGVKQLTKTNAQGFYSFPALPAGHYNLTIQVQGFKEYVETGLVLDVNTALRVDAALQVGTRYPGSQRFRHGGTGRDHEHPDGRGDWNPEDHDVPLNGRSYTDLLALQPGVVPDLGGRLSRHCSLREPERGESLGQRAAGSGQWVHGQRRECRGGGL